MDLGPVERVGAVRQVELARKAADVAPAVGVTGSGQMPDDSYDSDPKEQDRGMEEDALEDEECEPRPESRLGDDGESAVDILV